MLVVCFSFAVLLLLFVSHVISCTFLLFLSSVCLLHLPCICSHWLRLTLLQVAWLSFGFASALLRLAFAFLWLCLCLAWLHSGFVLDFVFVLLRVAVASLKMWFDVGLRLGSAWLAIFLARKFRVDSASALGPNCPLGATLSVCLSMCLLIFSSVCLFVCLSIYLSIHPPIHPSIYLSIHLCLHLHLYFEMHSYFYL